MRRWLIGAAWAAGVFGGLLLLAGYIRSTPDFDAAGDGASLALRTMEAIRTRQFVGPYSQFGWSHPGPLMFYLMAPLYYLSHYHEMSLRWMALVINAASLVGILVIARRRSAWLLTVSAAGLVFFLARAGGDLLFSAWNPHITLLPLVLFVFLCAELAIGNYRALPVAAFVGSFVAQSHMGFVPIVGILAMVSLAACWRVVTSSAPADRPKLWWTINATAWLSVVLWCLPLAEEIIHNPFGNIDRIIAFLHQQEGHLPIASAIGLFGHYGLGPLGPTFMLPIGWDAPASIPVWQPMATLVLVALTAAGTWLAFRRRLLFTGALGSLALGGCVVGFLSVYSIPTRVSDHQVFWVGVFVLLALASALSAVCEVFLGARLQPLHRRLMTGASAALVSGLIVYTVARIPPWLAGVSQDRPLRTIYGEFHEYLTSINSKAPEIRHTASTWQAAVGLVLQFAKHHDPVRVDDDLVNIAGDRYRVRDPATQPYLLFDADFDKQIKLRPEPRILLSAGSWRLVDVRDVLPPPKVDPGAASGQ